MIKRLETKVSSAELSVEFMKNRLQNKHKEEIADLLIGHRGTIRDLKNYHATNLAEEKKKLRQQLCIEHRRHNSLYNEVLDYCQDARVATKAGNMSRSLSSKRIKQLKAWQSKCLEMEIVKDELVNQQRSIIVMEQRLKEYSEVISDQRKQIDSIKPTIIAKQWVKNKGKKGGHMEWTVQCDKLVIELLANRVPPTSIQASILAMARSFFHEHDIVRELPTTEIP
jgi:hypothetical protein